MDKPHDTGVAGAGGGTDDFSLWIVRFLQGTMSEAEERAFNAELAADARKREQFVRACVVESALAEEFATQYSIFRGALAQTPDPGKRVTQPAQPATPGPAQRRWSWRYVAAAAALVIVAGGIAALWSGRRAEEPPPFARVTAARQAAWSTGPLDGGAIPPGKELALTQGWVEITYDGGTRVTFAAPARFLAENPQLLALRGGKLSATVANGGFTVKTADAVVTDLGTEFGVSADEGTEVAVFSGKVAAVSARDPEGKHRRVMGEGEAVGVADDRIVDLEGERMAWPQRYPRRLPPGVNALSVADLLSGGSGVMNRHAAALDLATGRWAYGRQGLAPANALGDGAFHPVPLLPVVNGCFIPNGKNIVDSEGHPFDFGPTQNVSLNQLRIAGGGGAGIPWMKDDPHKMSTTLAGVDYAGPDHTLLAMPGNKGLTLDLEALRLLHPGVRLTEFKCIVGNTYPRWMGGEPAVAKADIHVLVDGQSRLSRRGHTNLDQPLAVRIPLTDNDRFLTLAVTDGGDGVRGDWILFGDPELAVRGEEAP